MDPKKVGEIRTTAVKNPLPQMRLTWATKEVQDSILNHLKCTLAREPSSADMRDWLLANCYSLREKILSRFIETQKAHHEQNTRRVYYFSMEYLMGRLLRDNLNNCDLLQIDKDALRALGLTFDGVESAEADMGLGNGGLGRLAACFLDSLATLNYPAVGYGMYYEFGLFRQKFLDAQQQELADNWAIFGNPWQIIRPENAQMVQLYGHVEDRFDERGNRVPCWTGTTAVMGIPWDIPIVGYGATSVNFLRLWESRASQEFDFNSFNQGNYLEAVEEKIRNENISKVLYPNDSSIEGKELRLVQQYFFVTCSLQDIIRRHFNIAENSWKNFTEKVCIQLNDTHPTIAIVELMRILVDEEHLPWEEAWEITSHTFAYTNHTLLPEALEKWPISLLQKVLPRHLQIIYEINRRFLTQVVERCWPGDDAKKRDLSLVEEGPVQSIRMAYLAVIGSFSVNGVAAMHSELVKSLLFPDFYHLWPERFNNKTNGVTPRRWIHSANPRLANLLDRSIGKSWVLNLDLLKELEPFAKKADFREEFAEIKYHNKCDLAQLVQDRCNIVIDPQAMFDIQIKRIHEYKRQQLNLLHILTLYHRLLNDPDILPTPRVFIFGGKAAPGYFMAKNIIHAINFAADIINNCKAIDNKLKVAFIPNYDVSTAMKIIPAADISEQISTAGTEASGTGNMKLAMNGALTIGTLDGAMVEMEQEIGAENMFLFGKTADEILQLKRDGYNARTYYETDEELRNVLDWIRSDAFDRPGQINPLRKLADHLLDAGDTFCAFADYRSYVDTHERLGKCYANKADWYRKAIINVARMGKFSSDRTIREYAEDIWKLEPIDCF